MLIRLFEPEDTEQIAQLFHDTVRQINLRDYSKQQLQLQLGRQTIFILAVVDLPSLDNNR